MGSIQRSRQSGFTLVEIAIVLVIIGLLLGGVLKGQELIKNAKVKTYKTMADSISTAYIAYVDRYKAIPGDDPLAQSRFSAVEFPNIVNGNGNGLVEDFWFAGGLTVETNQFFMHLRAAGLLKGDPNATTFPEFKLKSPDGNMAGVGGHNMFSLRGLFVCFAVTQGEMAELVDIAYDDGRPGGGSIRVSANQALASYFALNANYKTTNYNLCMQL